MTNHRTPPAWRRAFLRELARGGSVTRAAEACGICKTTPYQLRKTNAAFAASWTRALERARDRLSPREDGALPPDGAFSMEVPASAGTREARLRPILRPNETIRSSKTGKCCIMKTGPGRWNAKAEAAFLAELTASANVKAAARAAGVSTVAVYNRRKLWPAFKAEWDAAVAEGFARIETLVVCAATTTLDPEPLPPRAWECGLEAERMTMDQALKVWLAHNARNQAGTKRRLGGPPRREPDIEEVRQEILRKVAAIKRMREAGR